MIKNDKENKKKQVGIFFGGKSAEHEISILSAKNVLEALDPVHYDPVLIGIDITGVWHIQDPSIFADNTITDLRANEHATAITLLPGKGELIGSEINQRLPTIDVAIPVLHGPFGEDGTIQGFLELANIPYVGPGVLGSAVGMDKDVMKRLLRDAGIPITPFITLYASDRDGINLDTIFTELGDSVFIKPANMGSSIGVSRAQTSVELEAALDIAFAYDSKVIVETAIIGNEIECAILGNEEPQASVIGRITPREGDFYSYEAKYIDEKGAILEVPANISKEISDMARALALQTFKVLNCEGMGRVDMFLTKDGEVLVNEINTIPGFTKISMYPKLWDATGINYADLISKLITYAIDRHSRQNKLTTNHETQLYT